MTHIYQSPYGALLLEVTGGTLCRCCWALTATRAEAAPATTAGHFGKSAISAPSDTHCADKSVMTQTLSQLDEYFRGERRTFSLPLRLQGTPFCLKVWHRLLAIPYGTTVSYKHLACGIGSPQGARAVARACSRNPICIIVPCHRVISSTGAPGGYTLLASPRVAGSTPAGIGIKAALLALERASAIEANRRK